MKRRRIRLFKLRASENERTLRVLLDVGFTEEESQAWLRNFRLLQHKNGKCVALNVRVYSINYPFIRANCGYI